MKPTLIFTLLIISIASVAQAQRHSKLSGAAKICDQIATEFSLGSLRSYDSKHLINGRFKLLIEHSIYDTASGGKEFESRYFRSFSAFERWMKKEERQPGFPVRIGWPLTGCRNGRCTFFEDGGISHNHVYLKRIYYGYKNKRLYIKTIQLLYG